MQGTTACPWGLVAMTSVEIAKPLARAIKIYRKVARYDLDPLTRRDLARHIKRLAEGGVRSESSHALRAWATTSAASAASPM